MSFEKPPKFIKDFSKDQSQEERSQTAAEIRAKRTEYLSGKKEKQEEQRSLQEGQSERQAELNEQLAALEQLEARIEELSSSGVQKI
ncbi:MAG: hypothetical protein CO141_00715 [Candidatus Moranbacteria bacterium CG_4_9_14_3_um_filter_42_9]|nr:MAG: hypothetical protein CO141_00715 [Candidatus Moranbacteria bacterium CG_4_9_14_3_um_filter_42_9]